MNKPHDLIIIGSGFGGIGMAIQLKKAGRDDFSDSRKKPIAWVEPGGIIHTPALLATSNLIYIPSHLRRNTTGHDAIAGMQRLKPILNRVLHGLNYSNTCALVPK